MGRFADLCGEVAAALEEDAQGLSLPLEERERFRADWSDEDIEDALGLVQESLMQDELLDAADSLSARMVEWLSAFGGAEEFGAATSGQARISVNTVGHLARRVARLEEVLARYRDSAPAESPQFKELRRRLADYGIEEEMDASGDEIEREPRGEDDDFSRPARPRS